jgi:hypothetical protein
MNSKLIPYEFQVIHLIKYYKQNFEKLQLNSLIILNYLLINSK